MPRSPSGASARPSPRVLIKSLELNALHTSRIRDMVRLNGNRSSLCHVAVPVGDSAGVYGNIGKRPLAPPWRNDGLHQMPNVIGPTRRFMLGGGLTFQMGHIFGERR